MNVRDEDRPKSTCTGRGLGFAAAAIGVGVGAAMYYFFSKQQEHPHSEGSTSQWTCDRPETFPLMESEDSYTTVSEHDTTDTSINNTTASDNVMTSEESEYYSDSSVTDEEDEESDSDDATDDVEPSSNDSPTNMSLSEMTFDFTSPDTHNYSLGDMSFDNSPGENILGVMPYNNSTNINNLGDMSYDSSDSESNSGDVSYRQYFENDVLTNMRQTLEDLKRLFDLRTGNRERSWTLEECSICFDVMLRDQEVMSLPCTHNFHSGCILPWLQEKQTCPVCRKNVD